MNTCRQCEAYNLLEVRLDALYAAVYGLRIATDSGDKESIQGATERVDAALSDCRKPIVTREPQMELF